MPTAEDVVRIALSQAGKKYVYGIPPDPGDADPAAFDCSGLVCWAAARAGVTPVPAHATWLQWAACKQAGLALTVDAAIAARGALLFNHRDASGQPVEPAGNTASAHVAISLGDGRTIEAMGTTWGTLVGRAAGRNWTAGGLLPGVVYGAAAGSGAASTTPPAAAPAAATVTASLPTLRLGQSNPPDAVARLQQLLAAAAPALPALAADGSFGVVTDVVLRAFQLRVRRDEPAFAVDGVCGPMTWNRLGQPERTSSLQNPSSGDEVVALQQALASAGPSLPAVAVDGSFGPVTDVVLRAFQLQVFLSDRSFTVDGVCGPQTWSRLAR